VASPSMQQIVSGFKVNPVDTTAAGDTFNGALAVAIAEGLPVLNAIRFANAAAAISVTRMGAQPSAPSRHEINQLLGADLQPAAEGQKPARAAAARSTAPAI
jgi:ribokinase